MSTQVVRLATVDDAQGIATVKVRGWQTAYRGLIDATYLEAMDIEHYTARTRGFLADPTSSVNWVCIQDDETVGWASIRFIESEERMPRCAELSALYTLPSVWGKGVGFNMWQTVSSYLLLNDVHSVSLWVLEGNERAMGFYARQGFSLDGSTKTGTLKPGLDLFELGMTCSLR